MAELQSSQLRLTGISSYNNLLSVLFEFSQGLIAIVLVTGS